MQQIIAELIQSVKDNKNITDSVLKFKEKMEYWNEEELSNIFETELKKYNDEETLRIVHRFVNIPSCHIKRFSFILNDILGSNDELFIRLHEHTETIRKEKAKKPSQEIEPIIETIIQDLKQDIVHEENIVSMNKKMKNSYYPEISRIFVKTLDQLEEKEFFIVVRNAINRYQHNKDLYKELVSGLVQSRSEIVEKVLLYIEAK